LIDRIDVLILRLRNTQRRGNDRQWGSGFLPNPNSVITLVTQGIGRLLTVEKNE
jgi:hypothetical protein